MKERLLLVSSVSSAIGGAAAAALGATGWPASNLPGAPGALAAVLVLAGFVSLLVGVFGFLVWLAGATPLPWADYLSQADAYAADGRVEYARTYYEEALRWGADPEDVRDRLALCEARALRRSVHREPT